MLTACILSVAAFAGNAAALVAASSQNQQPNLYTATAASSVYDAQATAKTSSPTSKVPGRVFDRFVVIWLENTDYDKAAGDPNLAWLAQQGITLSNYFGVTHPSEPNYVASISGDNFGMHRTCARFPTNETFHSDLLARHGQRQLQPDCRKRFHDCRPS